MTEKRLSFAIFGSKYKALEAKHVQAATDFLVASGAEVYFEQSFLDGLPRAVRESMNFTDAFGKYDFTTDYAISMGGDGTFLKTASEVGTKGTPIIGVNMGRLGFLANVLPGDICKVLGDVISSRLEIDERSVMMLCLDNKPVDFNPYALNDIAILKRDTASMISIRASLNGEFLVTYLADGLVVSTPSGSTAYSLSNGGPILIPQTGTFSLTPVAPHSLNIRPIVMSEDVEIRLDVESRSHNFLVAIDGRSEKLKEGTTVIIRKAPHKIRIVKQRGHDYFSTLRDKLMWGADARSTSDDINKRVVSVADTL